LSTLVTVTVVPTICWLEELHLTLLKGAGSKDLHYQRKYNSLG